jgi:hypothetical protein
MQSSKLFLNRLLAVAVLALSSSFVSVAQAAAEATPPEDHSAEYKTLTADFARLDKLFTEYNDPIHKLTILGYVNLLKTRAEVLGWKRPDAGDSGEYNPYGAPARGGRGRGGAEEETKIEFDQVKYDELRYDINLQAQRLANWLAPLRTPPPTPQSERSVQISLAKLNPNPANAAEVKAALETLDREIKRIEGSSSSMMIGSKEREAETARISRIKDSRAALAKEFTKARWDTVVGELKP